MRDRRRSRIPPERAIPVASRPIITLTSDFGLSDHYVAAMKAVLLRGCPHARMIDVTHNVPRHDILCASITLERAIDGFPPGTTHLAVVDPGVGTDRRLIVAKLNNQFVVCPDNGLITWSWRLHTAGARNGNLSQPTPESFEITWRPKTTSATFHGRDVMAPIAARIVCGEDLKSFTRPLPIPVLLDLTPADPAQSRGQIIHIDHFGNATTNIRHQSLRATPAASVKVNRKTIGKLRRTYWDVAPGKPLALIGSSGLLEIAVRDGSAHEDLKVRVGDEVVIA